MSPGYKEIQFGEVFGRDDGFNELKFPMEFKHFLFQAYIPRMPKYKIIEKESSEIIDGCKLKEYNSSLNIAELAKLLKKEQGIEDHREFPDSDFREKKILYIVDELGEMYETSKDANPLLGPIGYGALSEFLQKVEYYDPLDFNIKIKPNLFYDAIELDLTDDVEILNFCNKYGLLYCESYYMGQELSREAGILLWDFVKKDHVKSPYHPGRLSLLGFRGELSTYQNLAKLMIRCNILDNVHDINNNPRNCSAKDKKRKEEINNIIEEIKALYFVEFRKQIALPDDYKRKLTLTKLHSAVKEIKADIIKKMNLYIFDIRPEIYIEDKRNIYRYRFIYKNLLQALYLILFNLITDNGTRFFICKQCGRINALIDGRGGTEYCYKVDGNGNKIKGPSECKRRAEELRRAKKEY